MGQLSRRGTGLDARSGYGVSEELSRRAHPAGFVEEPEPSKVDGQVLGRDSLEGPEPVLDAAVEGVYVLYVIGPSLWVPLGICRPTTPRVLAAVLYALAESETRTASGANTEPSAAVMFGAFGVPGKTAI